MFPENKKKQSGDQTRISDFISSYPDAACINAKQGFTKELFFFFFFFWDLVEMFRLYFNKKRTKKKDILSSCQLIIETKRGGLPGIE
jgi:hypothetical protein